MSFYNEISDTSEFIISFTNNPTMDFGIFAKGYGLAANSLSRKLLKKKHFADNEAYPIVFLYRQAFELYLKGFYYQARMITAFKNQQIDAITLDHRLTPLANFFKQICEMLFPKDLELLSFANKVVKIAVEFNEIDKDSFAYRYPIKTNGEPSTKHHQAVNLTSLYKNMNIILKDFDTIDFGFNLKVNQSQELYELIQEVNEIFGSDNSNLEK